MYKKIMNRLALGLLLLGLAFSVGLAQLPELIPRSVFFSNPQKTGLQISPTANAWPIWPPRRRVCSTFGCKPWEKRMLCR